VSAVQQINDLGPSSYPEYPLQVFLDQEITLAEFTSRILALSNTINGLISSLGDQGTFLPATIVVSAHGGWDEEDNEMDSLRVIMNISTPETSAIVRIGTWADLEDRWIHSEIFVEGNAASKTKEGEIRQRYQWLDGER
jgi:hypothetical protein